MSQIRTALFFLGMLGAFVIFAFGFIQAIDAARGCSDLATQLGSNGLSMPGYANSCTTMALALHAVLFGIPAIFLGIIALALRPPG